MSEQLSVSIEYPHGVTDNAALVTPLGADRYRLDLDPIWSMMTDTNEQLRELPNFGDTIEAAVLTPGALKFLKVVVRAKLRRLELFVPPEVAESAGLRVILAKVEAMGGHWELVFNAILIVCVPDASPYDPTEDIERIVGGG